MDIVALGRKDLSPETRIAGTAEYLSRYVYRLVFDDNYTQAISSQVSSDVALTHARNGLVPSVALDRFETFAGTANGDEVKILHLPKLRYDVLDRPLSSWGASWGLGSSLDYLSRSEPIFRQERGPLRPLSAYHDSHSCGRMELSGRGVAARHHIQHKPDPDLQDLDHGIPTHQPSAAQSQRS